MARVLQQRATTLTDCTLADNNADQGTNRFSADGGGLNNSGTATLVFCTISGNTTSYEGGGVYDGGLGTDAVTLTDTIVAGDSFDARGARPRPATSWSTAGAASSPARLTWSAPSPPGCSRAGRTSSASPTPIWARSANNGGLTETMALEAGSPAIETGVAVAGVTTDEARRPARHSDAGHRAYQVQRSSLGFSSLTSPAITTAR